MTNPSPQPSLTPADFTHQRSEAVNEIDGKCCASYLAAAYGSIVAFIIGVGVIVCGAWCALR